ncbi:MAG: response regulator transcription factor, partial [Campylobacterales bacterium]|nr:response regulator transcription factor [Campylobacterales bacterium]
ALNLYNKHQDIHLILLDTNLPDSDGFDFAKKVRENDKKIPIVLLSNNEEASFFKEAMKLKLVDYLIKPFFLEELFTVVSEAVEPLKENKNIQIKICPNISYNKFKKVLIKGKEEIRLSKSEIVCLELLLKSKNKIVSTELLYEKLYDFYDGNDTYIKNLIYKIRKKIGCSVIKNVKKLGYVLVGE